MTPRSVARKRTEGFSIAPHHLTRDSTISNDARLLAIVLLGYAGSKNYCFPKRSTLMAILGKSDRTIDRHLDELVMKRGLVIERGRYSNRYVVDGLRAAPDSTSVTSLESSRVDMGDESEDSRLVMGVESEPPSLLPDLTWVTPQTRHGCRVQEKSSSNKKALELLDSAALEEEQSSPPPPTAPATTTDSPSREITAATMATIICATADDIEDATHYAMMAGHVLYDDDANELCERHGAQRLAWAALLLYARRARGQTITAPDGFIRAALVDASYGFNPGDAAPLQALFDETIDAAWDEVSA